jgi:anaerobic selenocysteine-containing dehydrogenase
MVEATCWIPREQLEQASRLLWESRPVAYYAWSGHEQHGNVTQTARAISLLYALTGSFDVSGGNVIFPTVPSGAVVGGDLPAAKNMAPAVGTAERPLGPARLNQITSLDLYRAILESKPYAVRGLLGFGANILVAHTEPQRARGALAALDFYAHADMFMNPTAEFADVILPVASPFERGKGSASASISVSRPNPWSNYARRSSSPWAKRAPSRLSCSPWQNALAWVSTSGTATSTRPIGRNWRHRA